MIELIARTIAETTLAIAASVTAAALLVLVVETRSATGRSKQLLLQAILAALFIGIVTELLGLGAAGSSVLRKLVSADNCHLNGVGDRSDKFLQATPSDHRSAGTKIASAEIQHEKILPSTPPNSITETFSELSSRVEFGPVPIGGPSQPIAASKSSSDSDSDTSTFRPGSVRQDHQERNKSTLAWSQPDTFATAETTHLSNEPATAAAPSGSYSPAIAESAGAVPSTFQRVEAGNEQPAPQWLQSVALIFGIVWVGGAAVILALAAFIRIRLSLLCRHSHAASWAVKKKLLTVANRLHIRTRPRLRQAHWLVSPIAYGVFKPTVILPHNFEETFSGREQEAVLAHELAHLLHRDPLWLLLADVTCACVWWHPATWWFKQRLRLANEWAADEVASSLPQGPLSLASALVLLGRMIGQKERPGLAWMETRASGGHGLAMRVTRLLQLGPKQRARPAFALVLAVLVLISALASSGWVRNGFPFAKGGVPMRSAGQWWTRSLAGVMVLGCVTMLSGNKAFQAILPTAVAAQETVREADVPNPEAPEARHVEKDRPEVREAHHPEAEARQRDVDRPRREPVRRPDRPQPPRAERGPRDLPPQPRQVERPRQPIEKIEAQLEELRHQLRELGDREPEKREMIARRIEMLERQLAEARERAERMRAAEELNRRLAELRRALAEAERAGQEDRADQLRREIEHLQRELAELRRPPEVPPRERPQGPPPAELERKVHHIRVAIENLHAAGLHEQARHLEELLERLQREGPRALAVPPRPEVRPPRPEAPPQVAELREAVGRLAEQVERMQAQMREMQQAIHALSERIERR